MKPKDFPFVFPRFDERQPLYKDGLLVVPRFFQNHILQHPLFEKRGPFVLELCSGNGEWICEKAEQHPETQFIAVEMQLKRVRKIWSKRHNRSLNNLSIVYGQAEDFVAHYVPEQIFTEIYINFPDPWPKKRHAKHRLIQPPFVEALKKVLQPQGTLTIVTDDQDYGSEIQETLQTDPWVPTENPYSSTEQYGTSYFGCLWEKLSRTLIFLSYKKAT